MSKHPKFTTPVQELALNLIFLLMGESRVNRTYEEYVAIAAKLPVLKDLVFKINELLRQFHDLRKRSDLPQAEFCRFIAGDERIVHEPYPRKISYETVRAALEIAGMRHARWCKA